MKSSHIRASIIATTGLLALSAMPAQADSFSTGPNGFTIDFVNIGNAGNTNDIGTSGNFQTPFGGVSYNYRMSVNEITQDAITKATNSGLTNVTAGDWLGAGPPATSVTWFEAASFVNWLNTSNGHQAAYNLTGVTAITPWSSALAWQAGGENLFRHKDAHYFLPSENEWYKAAFHKNNGVTNSYWDYATASETAPTAVSGGTAPFTAVFTPPALSGPAAVDNNGGLCSYGTRGQDGNVREWLESAFDGTNNSSSEDRVYRGGGWTSPVHELHSAARINSSPTTSNNTIGFRVASVPEPSSAVLLMASSLLALGRRRRVPATRLA
jgi:formylglycine-generating enzyme required for sulfatase activity